MATKALIFFPALSGLRYDGAALAAGLVYFYEPGTTTVRAVYTTRNKSVEAANPFTLDANGQGEVFLDGVYDVVAKTSAGVTKSTWEGYDAVNVSTESLATIEANSAAAITEISTAAGNVVQTLPTTVTFIRYVKSTDDANTVTFNTSDGSTIAESDLTLSLVNETIAFCKEGTVWYRV